MMLNMCNVYIKCTYILMYVYIRTYVCMYCLYRKPESVQ